jgi:hypothetical protein
MQGSGHHQRSQYLQAQVQMMQRTSAQWSALLLLEFAAQMWCLTGLLLPMADMKQMGAAAL